MGIPKAAAPCLVFLAGVVLHSCDHTGTGDDDTSATSTPSTGSAPPVIDPVGGERALNANLYVVEGEPIEFSLTAQDPDGDSLTWSAINVPDWATFDTTTATFSGTPDPWAEQFEDRVNQDGKFDVTFDVTDGTHTTRKVVTIHVLDATWTEKTIAELIAERPITRGQLGTPIEIDIASDTVVAAPVSGKQIRWIQFSFTSQVADMEGWEDDWVSDVNYACLPLEAPAAPNAGAIVEGDYSTTFGDDYLTKETCAELDIPVLIIDRGWDWDKPLALMDKYDEEAVRQRDPHFLFYVFTAAHYLRAADGFATLIETQTDWNFSRADFRVVITGHSKMGHSAIVAAAGAPGRVAGFMASGCPDLDTDASRLLGNVQQAVSTKPESSTTYRGVIMRYFEDTLVIQDQMDPGTLGFMALGTNDANGDPVGYTPKYLLGVSTKQLTIPNRVGTIPNEVHTTANDLDYVFWKMWVAHAFLDRPVPLVEEVYHERGDSEITVKARISSDIDLEQVRVWATTQDDLNYDPWDQFEAHPMTLAGDTWEGTIPLEATAYFVDILDVEGGVVSSAPQPTNEDYPLLGG